MEETVKKPKVPRMRRLVYCLSFCVFLGLIAASCSLPQAPGDLSWDTHLTIPLGIRTYGLGDLVKPDSVLRDSGSGVGMYDSINTTDATLYGKLFFSSYTKVNVPLADGLKVDSTSKTVIKPQNYTSWQDYATLPPMQHHLDHGTVSVGRLYLALSNLTAGHSGTVTITLPDFTSNGSPGGDTLTIVVPNVNSTPRDTSVSLVGYYVQLGDADPQQIALRIHDTASDNVRLDAAISRLTFIYYTGTLRNLAIQGLNAGTHVEKLPQGWESVHPTTVDGYTHVQHSIGATTNVTVNMRTYLNDAVIDTSSMGASSINLGRDTVVVRHGFARMIANYPDSMSAGATMTLNGAVTNCSGNDTVHLWAELRSPLEFRLDPMDARGDSDIRKIDNGELKSIEPNSSYLRIKIWNHLPVGGTVYLIASRDSRHVYSSYVPNLHDSLPPDTIIKKDIPIPPISTGGYATGDAIVPEFQLPLDSAMVELFKKPFFARTEIRLDGSDGDTLLARASDYVKVQIIAEIERRVNSKGDNNQ
jgi:hypothetical protein